MSTAKLKFVEKAQSATFLFYSNPRSHQLTRAHLVAPSSAPAGDYAPPLHLCSIPPWWNHPTITTLLPAVHFLEQAFAGADFSTEKFSAALSLISAALFQCPKVAKFSVAHFLKLLCDLRCSFSIAKSRKILRCSSSDI